MEQDKLIEALVKALGTMVETPEYQSDPNNIGQKVIVGMVRKPILENKAREVVIDCLVNFIADVTKTSPVYKMKEDVDYSIPKLGHLDTRLDMKTGETQYLVDGEVVMVTPSESTQALTWQADNK